jgi:hypothetical protein
MVLTVFPAIRKTYIGDIIFIGVMWTIFPRPSKIWRILSGMLKIVSERVKWLLHYIRDIFIQRNGSIDNIFHPSQLSFESAIKLPDQE